MRKKILIFLVFIILVSFNIVCYYYFNNKLDNFNEKYNLKISEYKAQIDALEETNSNISSNDDDRNYNCIYTQTFHVIDNYNYQGTVLSDGFVIVDKFQRSYPQILKYNKDKFYFEIGKTYEITFESIVIDGRETKIVIKDINFTDRQGLDQKQEICKKN